METEMDIQASLRNLRAHIEQMKSLIAWADLKQAEAAANQASPLQFHDETLTELRNEHTHYEAAAESIREWLALHCNQVPKFEREFILNELSAMASQVRAMNLPWQQARGG